LNYDDLWHSIAWQQYERELKFPVQMVVDEGFFTFSCSLELHRFK